MSFIFKKKEQVWVNIDIPTKNFTLHHHCHFTEKIVETPYKGVGQLKRDGGWLQVCSFKEAESLFVENYAHFSFIDHC